MRRLIWPLLLLLGCGGHDPGRANWNGLTPLTRDDVTMPAVILDEAREIETRRGSTWLVRAMRLDDRPGRLRIEGGKPSDLSLARGRWTRSRITATEGVVRFIGDGQTAMAQPIPVETGEATRNVLLFSIDTLRADAFSPTDMARTYALFAERGAIWTDVHSCAPWTLPAHVSMLTSQYPSRHGVRRPADRMGDQLLTLAQHLGKNGYVTVALTEGNYVAREFGFDRGFDEFGQHAPDIASSDPKKSSVLGANLVTFRRMLDAYRGTSVFAFLHTYEVHCPYRAHGSPDDPEGLGETDRILKLEVDGFSSRQAETLQALYRAEVAYLDGLVAPFLRQLLDEGWLVVLTSDHGEEFGEHGGLLHADTLFEEVTRIPLAIAGPGIDPGQFGGPASIIDIPVTIARLAGTPVPESWNGRDLWQLNQSPIFAESFFLGPHIQAQDPRLVAVWEGQSKLIQDRNFGRVQASLFNLDADPQEQHNLQSTEPTERDRLFEFMRTYLQAESLSAVPVDDLSEEQIELMRSLGYVE